MTRAKRLAHRHGMARTMIRFSVLFFGGNTNLYHYHLGVRSKSEVHHSYHIPQKYWFFLFCVSEFTCFGVSLFHRGLSVFDSLCRIASSL
ncbi:hypothetical protein V8F20_004316 [Naviculisporaceae sp. PSN 640]